MTIAMDISVLNDKQRTGIGVYTYNLVKTLVEKNEQDKFILFGISTIDTFDYLKNLPFKNYPNVRMKIYPLPARTFRTVFLLWQKLNWPKIENFIGSSDIFHSFNWYFPPQSKGKKVATVFDMTPILYPQYHQAKTVQLEVLRLNRIKNYADLVITISENSKKDFLKFSPKSKVEVVYPAVAENFKTQEDSEDIKKVLKKYNLKKGYFLSVATLEPRKNIKSLLRVFIQSDLVAKMVLVGAEGWTNREILELVKKYPHKIKLTGFVPDEDLPVLYSQALCLVYPSFYEGFGIPVLEALNCGTAVICSSTSSLPEVGNNAVFYINPDNTKSIRDALIKISKDENLRDDLIRRGFKQAKKFSWQKSAEKLSNLYQII